MTTKMNCKQRVDRVARDLWDKAEREYWDSERDIRPLDTRAEDEDVAASAQDWLATVAEVVHAVLPQVHMVAELEALSVGTLLVTPLGDPIRVLRRRADQGGGLFYRLGMSGESGVVDPDRATHLLQYGPLTVVWTPEVPS